jgi:alcohol dehydrogenase
MISKADCNPVSVRFGAGALNSLSEVLGQRSCIVIASPGQQRRGVVDRICAQLGDRVAGVDTSVSAYPIINSVEACAERLQAIDAETVVAVGGGSVIDTAKAVAAQRDLAIRGIATQVDSDSSWLSRHLRDGEAFPSSFSPPSIIAIPTTAGSGSEVTAWATVWDEKPARKYSLQHFSLYPECAIVDPALTVEMPEEVTVSSALDALSHALESLWSRWSNPVSTALASRAVGLIPPALRAVMASPGCLESRSDLHQGAMLAGLASSRTRTGLAHSISYPFTTELGLPHGLACSFALSELLEFNFASCSDSVTAAVAALGAASASEAASRLDVLFSDVGLGERMRAHLRDRCAAQQIQAAFLTPSRSENNPVAADEATARALADRALERLGF